jgi:hypothetical protein
VLCRRVPGDQEAVKERETRVSSGVQALSHVVAGVVSCEGAKAGDGGALGGAGGVGAWVAVGPVVDGEQGPSSCWGCAWAWCCAGQCKRW